MNNFVSELRDAYNYCGLWFKRYFITSFLTSFAVFVICMLYFPTPDFLLKTFLSSTLLVLCLYLLISYPYLKYSQHRFLISSYGFLALSDLKAVAELSSLFYACYHLFLSRYPIISEMFRKVIVDGLRGESLVKRLKEVAYTQPSIPFKEGLLSIILNLSQDKGVHSELHDEAIQIYKDLSSQIEMKFSIIMGLAFFAPIISILFISIYIQTVFEVVALVAFVIFLLSLVHVVLTRSLSRHKMV